MFGMFATSIIAVLLLGFMAGTHTVRLGRSGWDLSSMDPRCLGERPLFLKGLVITALPVDISNKQALGRSVGMIQWVAPQQHGLKVSS
jgi:hypothetical protein